MASGSHQAEYFSQHLTSAAMRILANKRFDNHLDGFSERQYGWRNKPTPNHSKEETR